MLISKKIEISINKFDDIATMLYKGIGRGIIEIRNELDDAIRLINIFIGVIPALKNMGIDVPRDVIEGQIKNLEEGLRSRDYMLIADTLKYEINDTLTVIGDLVTEGLIKDEELF